MTNLSDIFIDPLILVWYGKRWGAFLASGAYIPTGQDDSPAAPGKGYWTFMHQVGGSYYLGEDLSWSLSARVRFLHSTVNPDTDVRAGNETVFEYGIGKDLPLNNGMVLTVGAMGYSYFQLTSDRGPDGTDTSKVKGHAVGPDISLTMAKPFFIKTDLRYTHEYGVENNNEGDSFGLVFTFSF